MLNVGSKVLLNGEIMTVYSMTADGYVRLWRTETKESASPDVRVERTVAETAYMKMLCKETKETLDRMQKRVENLKAYLQSIK